MARPLKDGLEYFPVDVDFYTDIKVRRIMKDCGAQAITVLLYLLCSIYRDGYYITWDHDTKFIVSDTTLVAEEDVQGIIDKALDVGFFNKYMNDRFGILTSKGIQKRYDSVVRGKRRKKMSINDDFCLLVNAEETQVNAEETQVNAEETQVNAEESAQRKEKKIKENKTKPNKNNPPLPDDFDIRFPGTVGAKLCEWLEYKAERKEFYQPIGLRNLLSEVENQIRCHSPDIIAARITSAMASGWKGMNLDRINQGGASYGAYQQQPGQTDDYVRGRQIGTKV